jgi:hypothetical protein
MIKFTAAFALKLFSTPTPPPIRRSLPLKVVAETISKHFTIIWLLLFGLFIEGWANYDREPSGTHTQTHSSKFPLRLFRSEKRKFSIKPEESFLPSFRERKKLFTFFMRTYHAGVWHRALLTLSNQFVHHYFKFNFHTFGLWRLSRSQLRGVRGKFLHVISSR